VADALLNRFVLHRSSPHYWTPWTSPAGLDAQTFAPSWSTLWSLVLEVPSSQATQDDSSHKKGACDGYARSLCMVLAVYLQCCRRRCAVHQAHLQHQLITAFNYLASQRTLLHNHFLTPYQQWPSSPLSALMKSLNLSRFTVMSNL
jgi:hypothetical protein